MKNEINASILRCPTCSSTLNFKTGDELYCGNSACKNSSTGFIVSQGQPVLIDFDNSIFEKSDYSQSSGSVLERDPNNTDLRVKVGRFIISGENGVAERVAPIFASLAKGASGQALILVVGGGAIGSGTGQLYRDPYLTLVGTDVYASPNTRVVADAHRLPFADSCFDGIWIQAVLEHVLDPHIVAAELYRVLRPQGVIYADTPFMQQVHEKAYDFTRFTLSGHRWLFRRFDELEAGAVGGAGTAAAWSIRYLWRALGTGDMLATLLTAPVFWLRYLDRVADSGPNADAASSVYFLGRKSEKTLSPKDMPAYYAAKDRARPEPQTADGGIMVQSRSGLRRLMSIVPRSSFRFFRRLQGD